jgi:hypothetical protein
MFSFYGRQGQNKTFASFDELSRALFGRIRSVDSKRSEAQLARRVSSSTHINRKVKEFIRHLFYDFHYTYFVQRHRPTEWIDVGRYAYFYSPAISALAPAYRRNVNDAFLYLISTKVPTYQMIAFLADYSMNARRVISAYDRAGALNALAHQDARSTHYNVDESHQWVQRARTAHIRLGAGPSATTMQVLKMAKVAFPEDDTLLSIALGLFEFWNRHFHRLRSEIHTYHEVMVVAAGFGVKVEPDLQAPGEFDYPRLESIPL